MAKRVLTGMNLTLATVGYDAQLKNARLEMTSDTPETTDFDSAGWKEFLAGLRSATLSVDAEFEDLSTLEAAVWTAYSTGANLAFTMKEVDTTVSATNPEYSGNIVTSQHGFGGAVGGVHGKSYSFPTTGAIARATSP
jgi:predicted secreted protein